MAIIYTEQRRGAEAPDHDLIVLRHVAREMGVRVYLCTRSKHAGKPHVELYRGGPGNQQLGAFRSSAIALAWLQGRAAT